MYTVSNKKAVKVEECTFAELGMQESDIEEILRTSIDLLCGDEDSMLIVGRQVKNQELGRSDLVAVDNDGNIVLIEIKRDQRDIESRREPFEFQAIRYAASYATIENAEDLVSKIYSPYIQSYRKEFGQEELTSYELGVRKLQEFLKANDAEDSFNKKQRVILAASGFDPQTLSAVALLNSNGVDMSCFALTPYKIKGEICLDVEKVLPLPEYGDYYVNLLDKTPLSRKKKGGYTRKTLPKIDAMLEWGVVKPGDVIVPKGRDGEATLQQDGRVSVDGAKMSLQAWLKQVYGWASIETYGFAVHKESGRTLSEIRKEYMDSEQTQQSG